MYKININENTLILMSPEELPPDSSKEFDLVTPYTGKSKMLLSYIDMLEKTSRIKTLAVHYPDVKYLKQVFESLFTVVRASGGLVENEKAEILMIFRRGHWDLPKGKIDLGERKKQAALREVQEETGISSIEMGKRIITTRHSFRLKNNRRALKKTFWYAMKANKQNLVPQTMEDITEAKWVNPRKFITRDLPIYNNIIDVLNASGHLPKGLASS